MLQSPTLQSGALDGGHTSRTGAAHDGSEQASTHHASPSHGVDGISGHMQSSGQPPFHFNNTPFSQPLPSATSATTAPAAPLQQALSHSASPQSSLSPLPRDSIKYPMAAPPLPPNTPASSHGASNSISAPSPKSPQSPAIREQQRIELVLEINNELLQEIDRLQKDGQGGAVDQAQLQHMRNEGLPEKWASESYTQAYRRMQANLTWLMPKASQDPSKAPPGPALMTPPSHMTSLFPHYERLRALFPEWQGLDARMAAASSSPRPNGPNSQQAAAAAAAAAANGSMATQQQQGQQQGQY
ncbi:unnamed protein product [Zymoseptoria tritici ST99CH_3D1]|nr:unnamed protein product [Zymoseptoria tritici ST99CH_1E4]SMR55929.1 unnamed protein product [Zymoseptoria tritici ST99CH_3D1]